MSSSPPSIAAIVAATVAAATAWWASHGLLPPTPLHLPVPTPNDQLIEKQSTAFQDQNMASSSDDSEETGITKLKAEKEEVVVAAAAVVQDSQKKNPVDRSSCGLNTPSGSDAEIDALDKMEKEKEAGVTSELSNRRSKINNNNQTTDSWKEVSQGVINTNNVISYAFAKFFSGN